MTLRPYEIIEDANKHHSSYHTIHFPNDLTLKGLYDMSKYIKHYNIPDDLKGKTVLDVGSATGYFSFEFVKRGASKVVALDKRHSSLQRACNMLLRSKVQFATEDFMAVDEKTEKFDIVFCSNFLQHVSDMFDAIRRLRLVTQEMAIICTDIMQDPQFEKIPVAFFYGTVQTELDNKVQSFWQPNMKCLKDMMLKAGFQKVAETSIFMLESEDGKTKVRNGVVHAYP